MSDLQCPCVLICSTSGTDLSAVLNRIRSESHGTVIDLERHLLPDLQEYLGESDEPPNMAEAIRRVPRGRVLQLWAKRARDCAKRVQESDASRPRVLGLHLSLYNYDTQQLYLPVDVGSLRTGKFSRIIVLIDDIYDMLARLGKSDQDIYSLAQLTRVGAELAPDGSVDQQILLGKEQALSQLMAWRRAEMAQAENLASQLGAELVLLALKHSYPALQLLIQPDHTPTIYLSHRITAIRNNNIASASLPTSLGSWAPLVHEIGKLHLNMAHLGSVLICPTTIDELRFSGKYLSARWPVFEDSIYTCPERSALGPPPEYTQLFNPGTSQMDVIRATRARVFYDIPFRDHYIVEHTPHLLVFRPFALDNPSSVENAIWSGGVRAEVDHWRNAAPFSERRRALFVHTRTEVRSRLEWLKVRSNYEPNFLEVIRTHFRHIAVSRMKLDDLQVSAIIRGDFTDGERPTQLQIGSRDVLQGRYRLLYSYLITCAGIALSFAFSRIDRPKIGLSGTWESPFDVGIIIVGENETRAISDLGKLADTSSTFFRGELDAERMYSAFLADIAPIFTEVFGKPIEQACLEAIGKESIADLSLALGEETITIGEKQRIAEGHLVHEASSSEAETHQTSSGSLHVKAHNINVTMINGDSFGPVLNTMAGSVLLEQPGEWSTQGFISQSSRARQIIETDETLCADDVAALNEVLDEAVAAVQTESKSKQIAIQGKFRSLVTRIGTRTVPVLAALGALADIAAFFGLSLAH